MERRDFIKISALSGVMATLGGCRSAEHQLIRFIPEEELIPGIATLKPSVCTLCSSGCGLQVRVMHGDAEVTRRVTYMIAPACSLRVCFLRLHDVSFASHVTTSKPNAAMQRTQSPNQGFGCLASVYFGAAPVATSNSPLASK